MSTAGLYLCLTQGLMTCKPVLILELLSTATKRPARGFSLRAWWSASIAKKDTGSMVLPKNFV